MYLAMIPVLAGQELVVERLDLAQLLWALRFLPRQLSQLRS